MENGKFDEEGGPLAFYDNQMKGIRLKLQRLKVDTGKAFLRKK